LINLSRLTHSLNNLAAQSTGLVSSDVPQEIGDRYRLFIALQNCTKPVVTGTFALDAFDSMEKMLIAVRGTAENLRQKPLAIFDCCPSPPLKWSNLTCQNLIDCAKAGIPAELVSMPLTGATAPGTIAGALVQHAAESLSGVVIHQLAHPGSPIIWGGSPAAFDMRHGTTPMGAIETMMIDSAYARIGKYLGLPTHAYMALSDAKLLDAQAGLETGMGAVIAALSGINVISGPGMLDFESCQSLEKLLIDNEICGMALRLVKGIELRDKFSEDLFGDIYNGEHFLTSPNTIKWLREEFYSPSDVIDRANYQMWLSMDGTSAGERAHEKVIQILNQAAAPQLENNTKQELEKIMLHDARKFGMEKLPL
ncbi:MAG TPA: trimethylamine methyltransferase family protein, partial [bacterium]